MRTKRKKICSITTIASSTSSFTLEALIEMQKRGWDVTIICNMDDTLRNAIPEGMKYYHVPMERTFSVRAAAKSVISLIKIFKKEKFAVIQYGTTHASIFSSFAGWLTRIPCRVYMQWGIYNFWEMGLPGKFYKFVELLTCAFSTVIRPVSRKNLDVALREKLFRKGKGEVIGEGGTIGVRIEDYDLDKKDEWRSLIRHRHNIAENTFVFGFIGRISKDKGNDELIEAFRNISREMDCRLILAGPDERSVDRELMQWAMDSDMVILTGNLKHDDIPLYLSAMDILVHPTYREGFGMVLQEAMAMQIGIITTDIPGPSEVIEDGISGLLVPPKDMPALEKAMRMVIDNPGIPVKHGKNGRIRVEKHFIRPKMIDNICKDRDLLFENI